VTTGDSTRWACPEPGTHRRQLLSRSAQGLSASSSNTLQWCHRDVRQLRVGLPAVKGALSFATRSPSRHRQNPATAFVRGGVTDFVVSSFPTLGKGFNVDVGQVANSPSGPWSSPRCRRLRQRGLAVGLPGPAEPATRSPSATNLHRVQARVICPSCTTRQAAASRALANRTAP